MNTSDFENKKILTTTKKQFLKLQTNKKNLIMQIRIHKFRIGTIQKQQNSM